MARSLAASSAAFCAVTTGATSAALVSSIWTSPPTFAKPDYETCGTVQLHQFSRDVVSLARGAVFVRPSGLLISTHLAPDSDYTNYKARSGSLA